MQRAALALLVFVGLTGRNACHAEIIDQIAVIVGNNAITESQIDREIRLTAFVNDEKPDFSTASKYKAADRLINQTLVRQEMESSRYPLPPAGSEADLLDQIRKRYGSEAGFRSKLAEHGISEDDLKEFLLWQLTFVQFVDLRFRPGVQIPENEIRAYFDKQILPKLTDDKAAEEYASLHDQIQQKLLTEQVDQALDAWLKDTRARTKIEFRKEAFE